MEYVTGQGPAAREGPQEVVYLDGPRDRVRARLEAPPYLIAAPGGFYVRSVACADDGVLHYRWQPDAPIAAG